MDIDPDVFTDNANRFLAQHINEYSGKNVAWSLDGSQILIAADNLDALFAEADRRGMKADDFVIDYIPTPEELFLPPPLDLWPGESEALPPVTEQKAS